jgi:hypothetical protein
MAQTLNKYLDQNLPKIIKKMKFFSYQKKGKFSKKLTNVKKTFQWINQ